MRDEAYGYNVAYGYIGYVAVYDKWMLFASESEYLDYVREAD